MENVRLVNYVVTSTSYNLNVEEGQEVSLEVKEEISLKLPKDPSDTTFLLVSETIVEDVEEKSVNIVVKANAFFDCDQKLATYDEVVQKQCFPMLFKKAAEVIDQVLEVLNYPKLNLESKVPNT